MFGNKNKTDLDDLVKVKAAVDEIVKEAAEAGSVYESNRSEIVASQRQMVANLNQMANNYVQTKQLAEGNTQTEDALSQSVLDAVSRMKASEASYAQLLQRMQLQRDLTMQSVEEDKHLTSPSKKITEGLSALMAQEQEISRQILKVQELLLLPDLGSAGEELDKLRQSSEGSRQQISELSEQVRYLVGMLRDSTVALTQLLKESETTIKMAEHFAIPEYSDEVAGWREQLLSLRSADAEIRKIQERSRMQLEDAAEEIQTQNRAEKDTKDTLTPVFAKAKGYVK